MITGCIFRRRRSITACLRRCFFCLICLMVLCFSLKCVKKKGWNVVVCI